MNEEKAMILNMLKEGKITVEEAEGLLDALGDSSAETGRPHRTETEELKIDLEGMKESLKSGMKGFARSMEGTFKSAMKGLKSLDLGNVVSTAFGAAKESVEKELIISAEGVTGVNLKTGSGDIVITGAEIGGEPGDVLIQAVVSARGSDEENARERAEQIEIVHSLEDGVLHIKDSGSLKAITGPYSVDYRITLPEKTDLSLQTMDGDVTVRSVDGQIKVNNYSGDIHLKSCRQSIKANTKSGDVEVEEFTGKLTIRTLSGDLTFSDVVAGELSCNTLSGDIEGSVQPILPRRIEAKTLSGDIGLEVPETAGLTINAETLSGSIDCDLPVRDTERKGHRFTATLGEGDGEMSLSTKSGDISLKPLPGPASAF